MLSLVCTIPLGEAAIQKTEYQAPGVLLYVDPSCSVNPESWKISWEDEGGRR